MKKTVTLPDGTMEVLEGTPEEIAQHERLIREGIPRRAPTKKPDVIKGKDNLDPDVIEKLKELIKNAPPIPQGINPWPWHSKPFLVDSDCCMCGSKPCQCFLGYPKIYCALTCSTVMDRVYDGSTASSSQIGWLARS